MMDVMREGVEGTHGCLLLRGVPAGAIIFSQPGDHSLSVAFRTQGTRFQQRTAKVDAARVHIQPGVDIVQGVDDQAQPLPEDVIKDILGVGGDTILEGVYLKRGIDA
jgi:hypothetical protein